MPISYFYPTFSIERASSRSVEVGGSIVKTILSKVLCKGVGCNSIAYFSYF